MYQKFPLGPIRSYCSYSQQVKSTVISCAVQVSRTGEDKFIQKVIQKARAKGMLHNEIHRPVSHYNPTSKHWDSVQIDGEKELLREMTWWRSTGDFEAWHSSSSTNIISGDLEAHEVIYSAGVGVDEKRQPGEAPYIVLTNTLGVAPSQEKRLEEFLTKNMRDISSAPGLLHNEVYKPLPIIFNKTEGKWIDHNHGGNYQVRTWWKTTADLDTCTHIFSSPPFEHSTHSFMLYELISSVESAEKEVPVAQKTTMDTSSTTPAQAEPQDGRKAFTLEELQQYRNGDKIYIALLGDVFDVTKSRDFYGPGGSYHVFAGRDATRGLAKMDLRESALTQDLSDLDDDEQFTLKEWHRKFASKYPVVGVLIAGARL